MKKRNEKERLAVITGASSGIGFELARIAAKEGCNLVLAADTSLAEAKNTLSGLNVEVTAVECDLGTRAGVESLVAAIDRRSIDILCANAGHGLGHAFLDQDFKQIQDVIDTNITGTLYLLHRVGQQMRAAGEGRILVTGSIAGFQPGSFQAVYNGSKAFIDSFTLALRDELKDSGVSVTCLMPGVTDTNFFERADMLDTKVGAGKKMDPEKVAQIGFDAMMAGEADVVAGWKNKLIVAISDVLPGERLAAQHRKMAEPGSANPNTQVKGAPR